MPKKINNLIRELERAGFDDRGGKGSHINFVAWEYKSNPFSET